MKSLHEPARYTDLVANGIDVAIRLGKLADSALGARTLGMNPWVLVASPTYLRRHGHTRHDLSAKERLAGQCLARDDQAAAYLLNELGHALGAIGHKCHA